MALVTRFDTPGQLRDFPDGSPFYDRWHEAVAQMFAFAVGEAVDTQVGGFYSAAETDVNVVATRALVWIGFPRDLLLQANGPGGRREVFRKGDTRGRSVPGGKTTQNEYLEWVTDRDPYGRITRVTFTTEIPEYFFTLFASPGGPEKVLEIYRKLLNNPTIELEDLTNDGFYDPANVWNAERGIVHYIVREPPNNLDAAIILAAQGVGRNASPVTDNFQFPEAKATAADPRVTFETAALARRGLQVSTAEPIGLYIGGWDDTGWSKPDGSPVGDYWKVVRPEGASGPPALRLVYEVPASEGFGVGDIRIGGRPIEFGGQIAEHLTVMCPAQAGTLA
jgi:hypothetical protein